MSAKYKVSFTILCPFHKGVYNSALYCEGIYDKGHIVNELPNAHVKKEYMDLYCQCDWESCYIAKAIMMKYKEGEAK